MGKLHEVIAKANDTRSLFDKLVTETKSTFCDRQTHFAGYKKSYTSEVSDDYARDPEVRELVTTVQKKLSYVEDQLINIFDVEYQKEATNCLAKADIIVEEDDGKTATIATDVPASVLVYLEKKLTELRSKIYDVIPTLDPTKSWKWNEQGGFYMQTEPRKRVTRKATRVITKFQPTTEHPGQADLVAVDETCGYNHEENFSGMTTPKKKSILLGRVEKLIQAVKCARARANDQEVVKDKVAKKLFNYLNSQEVLKGE